MSTTSRQGQVKRGDKQDRSMAREDDFTSIPTHMHQSSVTREQNTAQIFMGGLI
jgi:hypothetical protein